MPAQSCGHGTRRREWVWADAQRKNPGGLRRLGPPDVLTGPVHPFGSLAALTAPPSERIRAHSFASPPHDGFAFVGEAPDSDFRVNVRELGCPADTHM